MRTTFLRCAAILILLSGCSSPAAVPATKPSVETKPPATKPAVIPTVLHFNEKSIKAILAGTKTISVRKGIRTFSEDGVKAVGTEGSTVMLKILDAAQKKLSELTADDAKGNGSTSLDDLQAELAKNYPGIKPDDVVTVIKFRLN